MLSCGGTLYDHHGCRKYLTEAEGSRFLLAATALAPVDELLCLVLYWSGCRVSEALELTLDRVDGDDARLVFRTLKQHPSRQTGCKPVKFRAVPVPRDLICRIERLGRRPGQRIWPWGRQAAWRRIKSAMSVAMVAPSAACPKGLRHHFGIMAASARVPPSLIQRWMGHAKLETTMIYLDVVGGEEREFAARMWPKEAVRRAGVT